MLTNQERANILRLLDTDLPPGTGTVVLRTYADPLELKLSFWNKLRSQVRIQMAIVGAEIDLPDAFDEFVCLLLANVTITPLCGVTSRGPD